ncbi:BatA domain-containing protein [Thalassotalea mangrovi]|uniref:Aerotolerance regulator N-terminal domain-containing protein n=1 Tax=Thalassotalea mangrovi TaxID=2572245 RepID=A0A4U1B4F2_9GAMM|nr:BatA domain-containing protein [Thalassotalea mangrovi]TKB44345.1 hypothetical protein E8M12_11885 [Thalassotalea mangrovi]
MLFSSQFLTIVWPYFLLALLALAIPVWIHWFTRQKPEPLHFAQLNLLPDTKPFARKHIQLQEKRLFIIRSLMVLVSVLLLVGLMVNNDDNRARQANAINLLSIDYLELISVNDLERIAERAQQSSSLSFLLVPGYPQFNDEDFSQLITAKGQGKERIWLTEYCNESDGDDSLPANQWHGIVNFIEYLQSQQAYQDDLPLNLYVSRQLKYYALQLNPVPIEPELNWHFPTTESAVINDGLTSGLNDIAILIIANESRHSHALQLQAAIQQINLAGLAKVNTEVILPSQLKADVSKLTSTTGVILLTDNETPTTVIESVIDSLPGNSFFVIEDAIAVTEKEKIAARELNLGQQGGQFAGMLLEPVLFRKRLNQNDKASAFSNKQWPILSQQDVWTQGNTPLLRVSQIQPNNESEAIRLWQLNSRFHPQWSDLLEQRQLPHLLYFLIFSNQLNNTFSEKYLLPQSWLKRLNPVDDSNGNIGTDAKHKVTARPMLAKAIARQKTQQLSQHQKQQYNHWQEIFAWLLCLLFIAERLLSELQSRPHRQSREGDHEAS